MNYSPSCDSVLGIDGRRVVSSDWRPCGDALQIRLDPGSFIMHSEQAKQSALRDT